MTDIVLKRILYILTLLEPINTEALERPRSKILTRD